MGSKVLNFKNNLPNMKFPDGVFVNNDYQPLYRFPLPYRPLNSSRRRSSMLLLTLLPFLCYTEFSGKIFENDQLYDKVHISNTHKSKSKKTIYYKHLKSIIYQMYGSINFVQENISYLTFWKNMVIPVLRVWKPAFLIHSCLQSDCYCHSLMFK